MTLPDRSNEHDALLERLADRPSYDPRVEGPKLAKLSAHDEDPFQTRAKTLLAGGQKITAGSVHLIGLDDIREALGHRWDSVKERVHSHTERLFQRFLGPQDQWFRYGDDHYIIAFAVTERSAAQLICARIVEQLHKALLGSADTNRVTVRSAILEVGGGITHETTNLRDLLRRAVLALESGEAANSQPESPGTPVTPSAPCAAAPPAATFRPEVCFRPVFDVRHKVVSTYLSRPTPDTLRAITGTSGFEPQHEDSLFALDMEALSQAITIYNELYANKFRYAQTITVHFATMASAKHRRAFIQACQGIPHHLIPFLAFELDGVPKGVPHVRLADIVAMLRPFVRAVMILTQEDAHHLPDYAKAGVKGVGIRLDPRDGEARCIERVQAFCPLPRRHSLFPYVDGVRTAAQLKAAEESGAAYLSGPMIGKDTEVPEHMRRLTERDMIERYRHKGPPSNGPTSQGPTSR